MTRMVQCVKFSRELPGLDKPPFVGELGEKVFNHVSKQAWDMWVEQQVIIINHYGLVLADPAARQFLAQQMEEFFFGEDAAMPEGWTPPGTPGDGIPGGKGGGVPGRKG